LYFGGDVKTHPAADLFPLLEGAAFDSLVADVLANGLLHPIVTVGGVVLDGRNRLRACYAANITPQFVEYTGLDPLGYVVGANLARRHLDESQRAMMGARLKPLFAAEAKERELGGTLAPKGARGKAAEKSAAAVNVSAEPSKYGGMRPAVSTRGVERAAKVLDHGAKATIAAVDAGELSVTRAAEISELPKREQAAAIEAPTDYTEDDRRREYAADFEAMAKIIDADDKLAEATGQLRVARKHAYTIERLCDDKAREVEAMKKEAARWMRKAKKSAICKACIVALDRDA